MIAIYTVHVEDYFRYTHNQYPPVPRILVHNDNYCIVYTYIIMNLYQHYIDILLLVCNS